MVRKRFLLFCALILTVLLSEWTFTLTQQGQDFEILELPKCFNGGASNLRSIEKVLRNDCCKCPNMVWDIKRLTRPLGSLREPRVPASLISREGEELDHVVVKEETIGEMYKISRYVNDICTTLPYISMPTQKKNINIYPILELHHCDSFL